METQLHLQQQTGSGLPTTRFEDRVCKFQCLYGIIIFCGVCHTQAQSISLFLSSIYVNEFYGSKVRVETVVLSLKQDVGNSYIDCGGRKNPTTNKTANYSLIHILPIC